MVYFANGCKWCQFPAAGHLINTSCQALRCWLRLCRGSPGLQSHQYIDLSLGRFLFQPHRVRPVCHGCQLHPILFLKSNYCDYRVYKYMLLKQIKWINSKRHNRIWFYNNANPVYLLVVCWIWVFFHILANTNLWKYNHSKRKVEWCCNSFPW